jgi:hypothetical protein
MIRRAQLHNGPKPIRAKRGTAREKPVINLC